MATPSPRNFSQYSGLDQFKQMQTMPSTYERLQNPSLYGPGTERDKLLKSQYSWALPLSERPATASGRSYNDPERIMERRMRDGGGGGGYAPGINVLPKQSGGGNLRRPPRPPRPYSPGSLGVSLGMPQGGVGVFMSNPKKSGRDLVANAMFPNTKGYFY